MLWSHVEDTFDGKVQILVNNAGVNPVRGWKVCMDIMIYGVMMGSYMARDKMGATKVLFYGVMILYFLQKLKNTNIIQTNIMTLFHLP